MVGIVLVSHSAKLVEGLQELIGQMARDAPIAVAGGTDDGGLGTSAAKILAAIHETYSEDGVVILLDMGSAVLNAEVALEQLSDEERSHVRMSDVPLVEGAVLAAIQSGLGQSLAELLVAIEEARQMPKNVN